MSEWVPGQPVLSVTDQAQWVVWRKERKRQQQRDRRAQLRRIDYHASPDTAALLGQLWTPHSEGDFSSIIDRIIREWSIATGIKSGQVRPDLMPISRLVTLTYRQVPFGMSAQKALPPRALTEPLYGVDESPISPNPLS